MILPIIIYDTEQNAIKKDCVISTNCFYFYSYQTISAEIVSGDAILYSVKNVSGTLQTNSGIVFTDNFGYTLYVPNDKTSIELKITNSQQSITYKIFLQLPNVIDDTNKHYLDLLTNANLPTYEQLSGAIPKEFNDVELIKRLLLDYKQIFVNKGTTHSVEKYFNFLGYTQDNLHIDDVFTDAQKVLTTNPNKNTNTRTGLLNVLYDNYTQLGLDEFNLPIRNTQIEDLTAFKKSLIEAINIANTYFTIQEQQINFFALEYSSNIGLFQGITSNMSMVFENDVFDFRKLININIISYIDSLHTETKVKNSVQLSDIIYKSECKIFMGDRVKTNEEVFFIEQEYFDDEIIDVDIQNIERFFGAVVHLQITSPNSFVEFEFYDTNNPMSKIFFARTYLTNNSINEQIAVLPTSTYCCNVKIIDQYNNTENYFYNIRVISDVQRIDFDVFNSFIVSDNHKYLYDVTLDVDSPSQILNKQTPLSTNYILSLENVPSDLQFYYTVSQGLSVRWLTDNDKYFLESINGNYAVSKITESINVNISDSWLDIFTLKYDSDYTLKMRVYDVNTCTKIIVDFAQIKDYEVKRDKIYVCVTDVFDRNNDDSLQTTTTPYYIITTNETGIDINKDMFDFVLVHNVSGDVVSIYDLQENINYNRTKIPVNYDFPLFKLQSATVNYEGYISEGTYYHETIEGNSFVIIKSLFPRLVNANISTDTYRLKLGDVFLCRLNNNYVVGSSNILWEVFNSFTGEKIFESNDYALKYRMNEKSIFDVKCTFLVDGLEYEILKRSMVSTV